MLISEEDVKRNAMLAKRQAQQAVPGGSGLGTLGNSAAVLDPALHRITDRVQCLTGRLRDIGGQLEAHANRVHGEEPQFGQTAEAKPDRGGALGTLEDALDCLEDSVSFARHQAERNCGLA